jgi:hypothetical protein
MFATYDTCDGCANLVALSERNVLIAWPETSTVNTAPELLYRCFSCGFATRRQLPWHRALELARTGINVVPAITLVPQPPDELNDEIRSNPQPLTFDDLLDLHRLLTDPGWLDQLNVTR